MDPASLSWLISHIITVITVCGCICFIPKTKQEKDSLYMSRLFSCIFIAENSRALSRMWGLMMELSSFKCDHSQIRLNGNSLKKIVLNIVLIPVACKFWSNRSRIGSRRLYLVCPSYFYPRALNFCLLIWCLNSHSTECFYLFSFRSAGLLNTSLSSEVRLPFSSAEYLWIPHWHSNFHGQSKYVTFWNC